MRLNFQLLAVCGFAALHCAIAWCAPLHVYLTYSGAPETTIDVNVVLGDEEDNVEIFYDTVSRDGDLNTYAHRMGVPYVPTPMELSDGRALYVAALQGLEPGTEYYFIVGEEKEYGLSEERKFRTLPGGEHPFRFVNGGDMGTAEFVPELLALAAKEDPDFALIGGDIAYVNGELGQQGDWDLWFDNWNRLMVAPDGRMIPIVTAIGNHETNRYVTEDKLLNAPWYWSFFGRQGEQVYYSRQFGDLAAIFLLDTGHLEPHGGAQSEWLAREMAAHADVPYTFAAYHIPLYPAMRAYGGTYSQLGRVHWAPKFDEYGLTIAMEHHDHVFKRTHPLKGGMVDESGTVYIGDGCFGRTPRALPEGARPYNVKALSAAHFWVVDVSKAGIDLKAIDHTGTEIDRFTRE